MTFKNASPLKTANWFSQIFFSWLSPLLSKGRTHKLEENDLYDLLDADCALNLSNMLECEWNKELRKTRPSLAWAMCRAFGLKYILIGFYLLVYETLKVVQVVLLALLVDCFDQIAESPIRLQIGYLYATAMVFIFFISPLACHAYHFNAMRMALWLRVASSGLVYSKILRLNQEALVKLNITTSEIVNLLSSDVDKFEKSILYLHYVWILLLQTAVVFILLWQRFGLIALVGCVICVLVIFFQIEMARVSMKLTKRAAVLTNERMKLMSEIINGIREIKMLCCEDLFQRKVDQVRRLELNWQQFSIALYLLADTAHFWLTKVIIFAMLATLNSVNVMQFLRVMNLSTIFLLMGLLQLTRRANEIFVPHLAMNVLELHALVKRLQRLLVWPELQVKQKTEVHTIINDEETSLLKLSMSDVNLQSEKMIKNCTGLVINYTEREKSALIVQNLSAHWFQQAVAEENKVESSACCNHQNLTLKNLTFSVTNQELVAIVGPVGAGKSSLLMTLLGELRACSGRAEIHGTFGHVSQQSSVFNETLRNNILCDQPFDEKCYQDALYCAGLDLSTLHDDDQQELGMVLTESQRAQISLARAIYQNADVYFLDDPLCTVDTDIAQIIFQRCIMDALANKPRILVTHNLEFVRQADRILVLQDGFITARGTYEELQKNRVDFKQLVREKDNMKLGQINSVQTLNDSRTSVESEKRGEDKISCDELDGEYNDDKVTLKTYISYLRAGGHPFYHLLLIFLLCICQVFYFLPDWWLTRWTIHVTNFNQTVISQNFLHNLISAMFQVADYNYTWMYMELLLGLFIVVVIRCIMFTMTTVRASKVLHNRLCSRLLRAPMLFYETNPAERVLSRYSSDVDVVDRLLSQNMTTVSRILFFVLSSFLIVLVINFWLILFTIPLVTLFIYLCDYYLSTSRRINRIESTTRKLIFPHIKNILSGLVTVRTMHQETRMVNKLYHIIDRNSKANLLSLASARWFALRLDFLYSFFITFVVIISVLMIRQLESALVGLSILYSMEIVDLFQFGLRLCTDIKVQMVAVERILECTQLELEEVSSSVVESIPNWPTNGSLVFQNVSFRHSVEQSLVLHDINFEIISSEKVGIVGSCASGKSSLLAVLYRLADIESSRGNIFIDGVSTRNLSLSALRSKLSVIPQDPVLFSGTIRFNLDPHEKYNDCQIWKALEKVRLKNIVVSLNGGLHHNVVEGGQTFSTAHRQLFCIARALLSKNTILIVEEATTNLDPQVEAQIQNTLRCQFAQCTVLTIFHQLHAVVDCDKVLVFDQGRVVQFDHPHLLLERKKGHFHDLVQSLCSDEKNALASAARHSFEKRKDALTI